MSRSILWNSSYDVTKVSEVPPDEVILKAILWVSHYVTFGVASAASRPWPRWFLSVLPGAKLSIKADLCSEGIFALKIHVVNCGKWFIHTFFFQDFTNTLYTTCCCTHNWDVVPFWPIHTMPNAKGVAFIFNRKKMFANSGKPTHGCLERPKGLIECVW